MGTAGKQGIWAFVVFLGIMLLHGLAIFLFTRGFLLTRTELSQYSKCNDIAESPCFPPKDQSADRSCWTKPVVNRLVIIVLDALSQNQSSAKIFKAIADPPTTSLQRLKQKFQTKRRKKADIYRGRGINHYFGEEKKKAESSGRNQVATNQSSVPIATNGFNCRSSRPINKPPQAPGDPIHRTPKKINHLLQNSSSHCPNRHVFRLLNLPRH
ncbi:GPI ethanolamine phosphate transferase 3 [Phtheirospermum japonicum]|uniref:GPI ethanolamine phosphate transferase 3 n=1 Tax=Phtheirospermum japonicum TaxID=374723 RepID=A0A830BHU8_9LAMI|nr:GPI ethanolamine phosphate transferase 3 [Phtheirospermum japonicum]